MFHMCRSILGTLDQKGPMILQMPQCDPLQEALSHDCHVTNWLTLLSRSVIVSVIVFDRFDAFSAQSIVF